MKNINTNNIAIGILCAIIGAFIAVAIIFALTNLLMFISVPLHQESIAEGLSFIALLYVLPLASVVGGILGVMYARKYTK